MARRTHQRHAILRALHDAPGPLTPQEIHRQASAVQEGLGLATVYRNLGRLEEEGRIVAVHLPEDGTRFEPAGRGHHHHFRCLVCEGVFELDADCPVALPPEITLPGGFHVEDHALTLYGRCPACGDHGEGSGQAAEGHEPREATGR